MVDRHGSGNCTPPQRWTAEEERGDATERRLTETTRAPVRAEEEEHEKHDAPRRQKLLLSLSSSSNCRSKTSSAGRGQARSPRRVWAASGAASAEAEHVARGCSCAAAGSTFGGDAHWCSVIASAATRRWTGRRTKSFIFARNVHSSFTSRTKSGRREDLAMPCFWSTRTQASSVLRCARRVR